MGDQNGEGVHGFIFFLGCHGDRFYSSDAYIGHGGGCAATATSDLPMLRWWRVRRFAACFVFIIPVSGIVACGVGGHIPPE
ncbi:hypothetical protein ABZ738_24070 [Micromonospora sp. NPDC047793]|uniref:hypothetical protein n=1 Tax=Micromonospora sp. NPDC047793 TaxID=3154342 RepID=UPI0033C90B29